MSFSTEACRQPLRNNKRYRSRQDFCRFACPSIPKLGRRAFFPLPDKILVPSFLSFFSIYSDHDISACSNLNWTICVLPHSQTGHAHESGLFLYSLIICDHGCWQPSHYSVLCYISRKKLKSVLYKKQYVVQLASYEPSCLTPSIQFSFCKL